MLADADSLNPKPSLGYRCLQMYLECWGCLFIALGLVAEWSTQILANAIPQTAAMVISQASILLIFSMSTNIFLRWVTTYISELASAVLFCLPSPDVCVYKLEIELRFDIVTCISASLKCGFMAIICLLIAGLKGLLLICAYPRCTFWCTNLMLILKTFFGPV